MPPAPQKSKLEQIADVATMLFPVWVSVQLCRAALATAALLASHRTASAATEAASPAAAAATRRGQGLLALLCSPHKPVTASPPPQLPSHQSLLCIDPQALISGCTAFFRPASLSWMTTQQFEWGVGLLMLAMGLSLTKEDFQKVGG